VASAYAESVLPPAYGFHALRAREVCFLLHSPLAGRSGRIDDLRGLIDRRESPFGWLSGAGTIRAFDTQIVGD